MADITLTFGKYIGKKLSEVPTSYVQWLSEQSTICGKSVVPQTAKEFLATSKPAVSSGHKYCASCREEIVADAVSFQEKRSVGGKVLEVRTRYLCSDCAADFGADE